MKRLPCLALLLAASLAPAAETPSPPRGHVDDRAGWLPATAARALEDRLTAFQQQSGHEIVVSIFPELPSPSMEDFTIRTAQAWRIGRKGLDDGVVVFVFVKDRKLRLEVGYGLEERIPDAIAKRILDDVIAPRLKAGDPGEGMTAGVEAIIAAALGRPLPSSTVAPGDDVPMPPDEDLHDPSGFLSPDAARRVRETVQRVAESSGCRVMVTVYPQPPSAYSGGYDDPDHFASRSLFRLDPIREGEANDAYYQRLEQRPTAMLFLFITEQRPLTVVTGYFATGGCPRQEVSWKVIERALLPSFAADPAGSLEATIATFGEAAQGRWLPPPDPTPVPAPTPTRTERLIGSIVLFRPGGLPVGPVGTAVGFLALLALPFAIHRSRKRRENFWYVWLMTTISFALQLLSSRGGGGTTYSGGGSSSSSGSSGGGGRFGGGGASGSW
jgi:uncharacterized membrane protein YgcG